MIVFCVCHWSHCRCRLGLRFLMLFPSLNYVLREELEGIQSAQSYYRIHWLLWKLTNITRIVHYCHSSIYGFAIQPSMSAISVTSSYVNICLAIPNSSNLRLQKVESRGMFPSLVMVNYNGSLQAVDCRIESVKYDMVLELC